MEEFEGDLHERFEDNLLQYGEKKAKRIYIKESIKLIRPTLMKSWGGDYKLNSYGMFKHQLKIVWRQTINQKLFSTIKIGGFAIGIAACLLITLYIIHQSSFDQHYQRQGDIYRLANQWSEPGETGYWTNVHGPLKEILEGHIPEMEKVARVVLWSWGDAGENQIKKIDSDYNYYEEGFLYADPELLDILEIPMVYGSHEQALVAPNSMVISKRKAEKYFPNENPVGKRFILNNDPEKTYTIGGVMQDFPLTSHLQGDFILTLKDRKKGPGTTGWCCTNYHLYTRLIPGADKASVEQKTVAIRDTHVMPRLRDIGASGLEEMKKYQTYYLQPVKNIYLNPEEVHDDSSHGSDELLWIFGIIAVVVLIQACINFINLSTANAIKRAKEVGMLKVVGSVRSNLISQYLVESISYTLMATLLGLLLAVAALPFFNWLADVSLVLPWHSYWFLPLLVAVAICVGLIAGLYPAFHLSSFQPIEALKGKTGHKSNRPILRNGLIIFQFTTAIVLIIVSLFSHQQFEYLMNKAIGYEKEQVVNLMGLESMSEDRRKVLKSELLKLPGIENASISDFYPVEGSAIHNRFFWQADRKQLDNRIEAAYWIVDEDYIQTMGMEIIAGRDFIQDANETGVIIINESMAEALQIEKPEGQPLIDMFDVEYNLIGVVKDFYFETLLEEVRPLCMVIGKGNSTISIKIDATDVDQRLSSISSLWSTLQPNQPVRYEFMDQNFELMYANLHRGRTMLTLFSILSIILACSGLFAISLYLIGQRSKEISIRKVLGAGTGMIFWLLGIDFFKLALIAVVLAMPIGWHFSESLIEHSANRIQLSWWVFALAGLGALIITLVTISVESIKTALANPIDKLKGD